MDRKGITQKYLLLEIKTTITTTTLKRKKSARNRSLVPQEDQSRLPS
jgi:hypothetical protein